MKGADILDQTDRKLVEIKLVSVNFVPSTQKPGYPKSTIIGQMSFDAENLPSEMQDQIRAMIEQAYREQFFGEDESK